MSGVQLAALTAEESGRRSIALARELDDPWYTAMPLNNHGCNRVQRSEVDEATAALPEETLSLRRDLGEPRGLAVTLASLAELHLLRGDLHAAESLLEEMTTQVNGLPHSEVACVGLNLRGYLHLFGGDANAPRRPSASRCSRLRTPATAARQSRRWSGWPRSRPHAAWILGLCGCVRRRSPTRARTDSD